jgi:predicted dithiol-disulfide oxidoreductase (DUF899 family)
MPEHVVGTREEHREARTALLEREKEMTRLGDELARQRQELPWVALDKEYAFETHEGTKTLAELFDGRSQLLVYHFMFGPEDTDGCVGCSFLADHLDGGMAHVNAKDVTVVVASRGPLERLDAYKERMGWQFPWVSSLGSDFNFDFDVSSERGESPGLSAFALEDRVVYHTYSLYDRGLEVFDGAYHLLDRAPKGRDEDETLPHPGMWWRRHDEYEGTGTAA